MPNKDVITFLDTINEDLETLITKLSKIRSSSGATKLSKEFLKIKSSIVGMSDELAKDKISKAFKKTTDSLKRADETLTKTIIDNSNKTTQVQSRNLKKTRRDEDLAFKRRIDQLSSYSGRVLEFFKMQLAWYPAKAFTFKLLAVPGNVIKSTAEYGDALAQVSSVAQLLPSQLKEVDKQIQETAATTKYNLTEVAASAKLLAQAGFKGDELSKAIKPISLLATATASTIQESTDLVSTIVRAYGKTASQITQITDTLAAAVTSSKLTIKELSEAFSYVASASSQAGMSFETTTAILGILANRGMKMTTAATGLRMALLKMMAPTKQAAKELEKLGLESDALDPAKHSIEEIIKLLKTLDPDSLIKIFSARSAAAIMSLTQAGADSIKSMKELIDKQGIAASMAAEQLLDLKQSWKNLLDVIDKFYVSLGETFSDELAIKIRTFRNIILDIEKGTTGLSAIVKILANNLGKLILTFSTFSTAKLFGAGSLLATSNFVGLKEAVRDLGMANTKTGLTLISLKEALLDVKNATGGFIGKIKTALGFINPWYLAITAIAGAIGFLVYKNYEFNRSLEESSTRLKEAKVNFAKFSADVAQLSEDFKLKIKISKQDSILGEAYLKEAKQSAINQLTDMISSLQAIAKNEDANVLSILRQELEDKKDINLQGIRDVMQDAQKVIEHQFDEMTVRSEIKAMILSGKLSEGVTLRLQEMLKSGKSLKKAFADMQEDAQLDLSNGPPSLLEAMSTYDQTYDTVGKETVIHEIQNKFKTNFSALIEGITEDTELTTKKTGLELREKFSKVFLQLEGAITDFKQKSKDKSYSKAIENTFIKPVENVLKIVANKFGEDSPIYEEFQKKFDNLLTGLYPEADIPKLTEKLNEVKTVFKNKLKDLSSQTIDKESLAKNLEQLKPGAVKAANDLAESINKEISLILSHGDISNEDLAVLQDLKNQLNNLYTTDQIKLSEAFHDNQIKIAQSNISVFKSAQELAKEQGQILESYKYSEKIYNEQIKVINEKIAKENALIATGKALTIVEKNKIQALENSKKLINRLIALNKINAKYESTKKELDFKIKIAKANHLVTESKKLQMTQISKNIVVLKKELKLESTSVERKKEINAELTLLNKQYHDLFNTLKESKLFEGFAERLKEINEEYKQVGITAKDGIELADGLNKTFSDHVIDGFSEIIHGTKTMGNVFKDTLSDMLRYFKDWVIQLTAKKIILPIAASAVGSFLPALGFSGLSSLGSTAGSGFSWSAAGIKTGLSALGGRFLGGLSSIQGSVAGMLPGVPSGAGIVYPSSGTGLAGFVSGLSPSAFMGGMAGLGTFVLNGLRTGDWGSAAAQGLGAGAGTWAGAQLGTMIMPGIGTLIGGALGGVLSSLGIGKLLGGHSYTPYINEVVRMGRDNSGKFVGIPASWPADDPGHARGDYEGTYVWSRLHGGDINEATSAVDKVFVEAVNTYADKINNTSSMLPESIRNVFDNLIDTAITGPLLESHHNISNVKSHFENILNSLQEKLSSAFDAIIEQFGVLATAMNDITPNFAKLIDTLSQATSNYFDPLLAIDKQLKESGGNDYIFSDLVDKADTLKLIFENAVANNAPNTFQIGQQYANTLVELDPITENLNLRAELADIRSKMLEVGGTPEDFQASVLRTLNDFKVGVQESIDSITTAIRELHPEINLDVDVDLQIDDTGTNYNATIIQRDIV